MGLNKNTYSVYIIHSKSTNRYYTGTTDSPEKRLIEHNSIKYDNAYTKAGIPWKLFLVIDSLHSKQAFSIEKHIKSMKSKKYIENLKRYPEMIKKLKERFQ